VGSAAHGGERRVRKGRINLNLRYCEPVVA
jgi:hypothetical protein